MTTGGLANQDNNEIRFKTLWPIGRSRRARWILGQCAQSARQHDHRMREFYERIERKHGSQKAIVAVARKMLAIMYVMLVRNEPYHDENHRLTEQKHKRLDTLAESA